jgi:hypothetical protein
VWARYVLFPIKDMRVLRTFLITYSWLRAHLTRFAAQLVLSDSVCLPHLLLSVSNSNIYAAAWVLVPASKDGFRSGNCYMCVFFSFVATYIYIYIYIYISPFKKKKSSTIGLIA